MSYPEDCIRGILKDNFVVNKQDCLYATAVLYQFCGTNRPDGMYEASINWCDDESAIEFTFGQKNNDETLKYDGGVAILQRSELDKIKKRYGQEQFNYERAFIPDNKYHGNLLLNSTMMTPTIKNMIRSVLAHNSEIRSRNSIQST